MSDGDPLLDDLAAAVLDGAAVDWVAAESSADPATRTFVRHLRLVSSIVQVHHNLPPTGNDPPVLVPHTITATSDRWGHLRLLEGIGSGAFGEVFRAWDTRLDREVALKLLPTTPSPDSEIESSIIREGRLLAKVRHPNVITIYGAEQIGDRVGIWMEFVRGQTLEQRLQPGTVFSAAEAVDIGVDLCRAVSAVHAAGVLHRDIKAHNVTRAEDGRVVLMDFGTGRELDDNSSSDLTGTPLYVAPEVFAGKPATIQSDIYSLGVLLYHLVTRSYPVPGRTIREVRQGHEHGERIAVRSARPDLRAALARAIERACAPEPERRYENVDALARDLVRLQRRPWRVGLQYGLAAAAAVLLAALLTSEVRARWSGDHGSLLARLASVFTGAPSPVEHPVIAVLPFKNLGVEAGSKDLADGLTVGLIEELARIDGLSVRSQASSFALENRSPSARDTGRRLGANFVVVGSVRLSGEVLRVSAELVRAATETSAWSGHFDRPLTSSTEFLAIQDEISRAIVNALRLKLGRGQRRYELSPALFYQDLRAKLLHQRRGRDGSPEEAAKLFEAIVARRPDYAPGWAGLASALAEAIRITNPQAGLPSAQDVDKVRAAANRALDLDPMSADAHAAIGAVFAYDRHWRQAEEAFGRALALNPSRTTTHTDFVLSSLMPEGKLERALELLAQARTVDPLSLDVRRATALIQLFSGRYDDAIQNCQWVLVQDPGFPFAERFLGQAFIHSGRLEEALAIFENDPNEWPFLGFAYAVIGRRADAEALAAMHPEAPGRQLLVYAGLGDKDRTFARLEGLAAINWWEAAFQMQRPELALLRGDRRVAALRQRLRLPPLN
jgi:TolB-like protein/tRNA A-37 threonylcarbamoyl transferase component Bud32/Flp pilus assembly protein TadD